MNCKGDRKPHKDLRAPYLVLWIALTIDTPDLTLMGKLRYVFFELIEEKLLRYIESIL